MIISRRHGVVPAILACAPIAVAALCTLAFESGEGCFCAHASLLICQMFVRDGRRVGMHKLCMLRFHFNVPPGLPLLVVGITHVLRHEMTVPRVEAFRLPHTPSGRVIVLGERSLALSPKCAPVMMGGMGDGNVQGDTCADKVSVHLSLIARRLTARAISLNC